MSSCYRPIKGFLTPHGVVFQELGRHDILGDIEVPCGVCIGCRMRRAGDWALRITHEAQCHDTSCFVTLTYSPEHLPALSSLDHRDWQLFMKRTRSSFRRPVRFYMCGEYGPLRDRPHYHAVLFGIDFREDRKSVGKSRTGFPMFESARLDALWGKGRCTVQDLNAQTAAYCSRYIMKKALGRGSKEQYRVLVDDEIVGYRRPEYQACSLKPGLGSSWFARFGADVFPCDFVVDGDGKRHAVPRYYDKLLKRRDGFMLDDVKFAREVSAREHQADNTPERRQVREVVHLARVATHLKRSIDE